MPALYDTSKFYKSELKRTDTMESIEPNAALDDDDDDEEDMTPLPTRSNYTLQVSATCGTILPHNFMGIVFTN